MNKEMRRERTRQEFILASKQIIENEGISHVSARRVGELSGYSYATIYNYFKDINTLLTYVSVDYLEDSYLFTVSGAEHIKNPVERLIHYAKRYTTYMIMYPSIFSLIFINDFGESVSEVGADLSPKVAEKLVETLQEMNQNKFILSFDVIVQLLASSIHAKILFYNTKRGQDSLQDIHNQLEKEIREVTNQ